MKQRVFIQIRRRAIVVVSNNNADTLHYVLKDHLGSWTVITDEEGAVEQELSYDAWGNLRNPGTWCVDATIRPMFDRGYTGHEHHVGLGLINMNGRMYDPVMSSFLSVDRYVQNPGNSQGFNRYAYCMYNPLKYTDPSGWTMIGGNKPRNPFHDDWSVSHVAPVFEPSDFTNAYHLVNQALYGDGSEFLGGSGYGAYFKAGVEHYKGASPGNIWSVGSLANNYIHNPSTFNRRELLDAGVKDFTYSKWWNHSGNGGYQVNLVFDFGITSYGNNNYYYGPVDYWGAIVGGKDLSKRKTAEKEIFPINYYLGNIVSLVGGAAKAANDAVAGFSNTLKTIGIIGETLGGIAIVTNATTNYYLYKYGETSLYSMFAKDFMTFAEFGIAHLPYGIGVVPSIILTTYDIGGGFEQTIYNKEWATEFFHPKYEFQQITIYYRHGK